MCDCKEAGVSKFPVPLNEDLIIFTKWRNKTGVNKSSELGLSKAVQIQEGEQKLRRC